MINKYNSKLPSDCKHASGYQWPFFHHPYHFYAGCPSCRNVPNLSWLGTGTMYATSHTHWLR